MRMTQVEVTGTRMFPNPLEPETLISPKVKLTATVDKNDDVRDVARGLQELVERLVQEQQYEILSNIEIAEAGMADEDPADPLARAFHNTKLCRAALKG